MKNSGNWTTPHPEDMQKTGIWEALSERTFEDSKYDNGRMPKGKIDKVTAVNGTQPSSRQSRGLINFMCLCVFVQLSKTGDSALDCG